MLGKALVTIYVVRGWADPKELGGWGSAVAMQAEQTFYEVKDSRGRPKDSGHQTWLGKWCGLSREDMSEAGLGYPGQDRGFGRGHQEICDSGLVGPQLRTLSPLLDGVNYNEVSVTSWTGLTPQVTLSGYSRQTRGLQDSDVRTFMSLLIRMCHCLPTHSPFVPPASSSSSIG